MKKTATSTDNSLPESYEELCSQVWLPRPIADDVDYKNALEVVERLIFRAERTNGQNDYLTAVSMFVEDYESSLEYDWPDVSVPQILAHLCESHGMTAADLGRLLGDQSRSLGTKLLSGERDLSKAHIKILCTKFKLRPNVLLGIELG